jgi:hypothetical protein
METNGWSRLLDFSNGPTDIALLESVVEVASGPTEGRSIAERLLLQYQEHPQAWQQVDNILSHAKAQSTKYFALQVRGCSESHDRRFPTTHSTHALPCRYWRMSLGSSGGHCLWSKGRA